MIQPDVLREYMRRFIGFGSPKAPTWFIGLEQGGGENLAELDRRLSAWVDVGAAPFGDFQEYCRRIGERRWHGDTPRIQSTLGKLVRVVLASQGIEPTPEVVRKYQAQRFGCANEQTVIAELMPLPSRSLSDWIYAATGVPGLETRDAYVREYRPLRTELLRAAISIYAPRAVVFMGLTESETWAQIAASEFADGPAGALWASSGVTRFVIAKHPTAFGAPNAYFDQIGRALAA